MDASVKMDGEEVEDLHHQADVPAPATDVSILRDREDGTTDPMTLRELREHIQSGGQVDMFEIGGCGCFMEPQI